MFLDLQYHTSLAIVQQSQQIVLKRHFKIKFKKLSMLRLKSKCQTKSALSHEQRLHSFKDTALRALPSEKTAQNTCVSVHINAGQGCFSSSLTLTDNCLPPRRLPLTDKQSGGSQQRCFVKTACQYGGVSVHMSRYGLPADFYMCSSCRPSALLGTSVQRKGLQRHGGGKG